MSDPKTLLQMAGADVTPAGLDQAALLVIDAQNEYVDGALVLPGVRPALDQIATLLARARAAGVPVLHVAHKGRPGGAFDRDAARGQIADPAAPVGDESVVEKSLPNAFAGTDLEARLRDTGRDNLIVAGFMTHMCVSSTVRAALDLGFGSTVVAAATATRPLPNPGGGVIDADALHWASLAALGYRFAVIAPDAAAIPDG